MKKKKYSSYNSLKRTILVNRIDQELQNFLFDTGSALIKDVEPFEDDKISESMSELLFAVEKASAKYRTNVASELRKYQNLIHKNQKVSVQ